MKTAAQILPVELAPSGSKFADYLELTKPRLNMLVLITTLAGFYLGSGDDFHAFRLFNTLLGTALVAAGASALNQFAEREADAKMPRTQGRPLPAGRLQPYEALWFGVVTSLIGSAYLAITVNLPCALLAGLTWYIYLCVYTPLKTHTPWNTAVGAIPGALPPVIGWAAARNQLSLEAAVLFGILFLWQFPHFLAIAWMYRDDYARGGFKMLPLFDPTGIRTGRYMTVLTVLLVAVSLLPTLLGLTGWVYFTGALLLGLAFLAFSLCCTIFGVNNHARRLFFASIIYLPLLLALMTLNKI